jgi:thioredoxin 1
MYKSYEELGINPKLANPNQDQYQVLELQNIDHRDHIIKTNRVVVIDIYADWCGPCKMSAPDYANLAAKFNKPGQVMLVKYKLDNMHQMEKSSVTGIPLFLFYVDGRQVENVVGGNIPEVEEKLTKILGAANYQGGLHQGGLQQGGLQQGGFTQAFPQAGFDGPNASKNSIRNSRMNMPSNEYGTGQPYMAGSDNYHKPYSGGR